ncbi:MAG: hypothetical protein EZS28_004392 [Streblomastix strix]|uniref:Uncharacterized protein n=1 Tax=Streblomastix strix TaxID=222440 RepID=A0A5J4WYY6_9EUKA|nr:MAG: hypothetical protein EZS28_004392 [Streblomastix strix]
MLKQQQSMRKEGEKLSKEAEAYFEQKRGSISSQSSVNDMKRNDSVIAKLMIGEAAQIIQRETRAYLARKMAVGRQLMVAHAFRRRKQQLWNYRITYIASCTPQLSRIDMRKILVEQQEQNIKNLSDLIKQACLERKRIIITSIPRTLLPQFQTVVNQLETEFAVRDQGERKLLMGREWIPQYNPITNERVYLNVRTGEETHVHPQLKYLQNETEDSLKHTDYLYNQTSEMISSFSQWMMSDMQKSRKQSIDICLISFCEQFSKYLDTQKRSIERQLQKPPQKKKDGILKLKFGKNMSNQGSNIGTPSKLSDRSDKSAHTYSNRSGNNSPENPLENYSVSIQSEYLIKPNPGPLFLPQPNKLIPHNVKVIDRETGSAFIPTYSMIRNIEIILWGDQKRVRKQHKEEHIGRRFWKHLVRSRFNELNDILNDSEVFRIQNDIEAEMEWREEEIAFAELATTIIIIIPAEIPRN